MVEKEIIRVFPRRTGWTPSDDLTFVGDPPLIRPSNRPVRISVTFTWDLEEGKRLERAWSQYYPDTVLGGPALDDPGDEFSPGMFLKEGVTITSRGCIRTCPWCFVPIREGWIREIDITPGWIIQDNNLLACSKSHTIKVFRMLQTQRRAAKFSGGLDPRLFYPWIIPFIKEIRIDDLWFSCDQEDMLGELGRVSNLLSWLPENKKRCYVMIGYGGERLSEARDLLEKVYEMGFLPFAQLYRDAKNYPLYEEPWRELARKWSRPAAYRVKK